MAAWASTYCVSETTFCPSESCTAQWHWRNFKFKDERSRRSPHTYLSPIPCFCTSRTSAKRLKAARARTCVCHALRFLSPR